MPIIIDGKVWYVRRCHRCDKQFRTRSKYSKVCPSCWTVGKSSRWRAWKQDQIDENGDLS